MKTCTYNNAACFCVSAFSKKLGLPGFDKLKEIFSLDIKTVTVGQALDILDDLGLSDLKKKITEFLSKIEVC